jgi:hypothetical protein
MSIIEENFFKVKIADSVWLSLHMRDIGKWNIYYLLKQSLALNTMKSWNQLSRRGPEKYCNTIEVREILARVRPSKCHTVRLDNKDAQNCGIEGHLSLKNKQLRSKNNDICVYIVSGVLVAILALQYINLRSKCR